MLTNDDLQQIRMVMREEIQIEGEKIRSEFRIDIVRLENRMVRLEERIIQLDKRILRLEKEVKELRMLLNETIGYFDTRLGAVLKRLERTEKHLGIYRSSDPLIIYDKSHIG